MYSTCENELNLYIALDDAFKLLIEWLFMKTTVCFKRLSCF